MPEGQYLDEEIRAWLNGYAPLTVKGLVWYWRGQTETSRRNIQLDKELLEVYAKQSQGVSTVEDYQARIAQDQATRQVVARKREEPWTTSQPTSATLGTSSRTSTGNSL